MEDIKSYFLQLLILMKMFLFLFRDNPGGGGGGGGRLALSNDKELSDLLDFSAVSILIKLLWVESGCLRDSFGTMMQQNI